MVDAIDPLMSLALMSLPEGSTNCMYNFVVVVGSVSSFTEADAVRIRICCLLNKSSYSYVIHCPCDAIHA